MPMVEKIQQVPLPPWFLAGVRAVWGTRYEAGRVSVSGSTTDLTMLLTVTLLSNASEFSITTSIKLSEQNVSIAMLTFMSLVGYVLLWFFVLFFVFSNFPNMVKKIPSLEKIRVYCF